jgi:hypothetical protein
MAVYKLFPEKDATLYSLFPTMNTGLDSQIESTAMDFGPNDPNPQVSRFLIQFDNTQIGNVLDNLIDDNSGTDWKAYLRLFSSKATGLSTNTTIDIHLAAKSWDMGTGLYLDSPLTTNGTSWIWRDYLDSPNGRWISAFNDTGSNGVFWTGSYSTSSVEAGGGQWVYSSPSSSKWSLSSSVTFNYRSDLDVTQDVTELVYHWVGSGSTDTAPIITNPDLSNYGFLVKLTGSQEFVSSFDVQPELKYFSVDTQTIYPPQLEFRWDDCSWFPDTEALSILTSSTPFVSLAQNPGEFNQDAVNRFRVNSRPEYPAVVFQTASIYTTNYYLPENSTYAIKDLDTNLFVVNFDPTYTRLSADSSSCYFDIYMNGLEPERYYKILISSSLGGNEYVLDNKYYFKVING